MCNKNSPTTGIRNSGSCMWRRPRHLPRQHGDRALLFYSHLQGALSKWRELRSPRQMHLSPRLEGEILPDR